MTEVAESPLSGHKHAADSNALAERAGVILSEDELQAHINLRAAIEGPNPFGAAVAAALGFDLPLQPNTMAEADAMKVY